TFKLQTAQYMSRASHFNLCRLSDINKSFHTRALYQETATYCRSVKDYVSRDLFDALMHDEQEDSPNHIRGMLMVSPDLRPQVMRFNKFLDRLLNRTATLSRRHLEQFVSAIDDVFFRNCSISHLNILIWLFTQPEERGNGPRDPQDFNG